MFTLVLIADDIPVKPSDFRDCELQLKREIQLKYVDKVIPRVGLCIEFYDFVAIKDAHIYPGDGKVSCGEAYFKVEFHVIVFQPRVDEWLVGSISASSPAGLRLSLGFFKDVAIPAANLRTPYVYDATRKTWAWQYRSPDSKEAINFFYELGELVRFRVTAVNFPEPFGPTGPLRDSAMRVVGAVDRDGLGCVSWWPSAAPATLVEGPGAAESAGGVVHSTTAGNEETKEPQDGG